MVAVVKWLPIAYMFPGQIKMERLRNLRSWMRIRLFTLVALLCLSTALRAQPEAPAHYQIYGGYAFLSNSMNGVPGSHQPLNGWDASLGFPSWHNLRFKIDVAGCRGTNLGAPQHPYSIAGGAQYEWRFNRETVFAEFMGGDAGINENWGAGQIRGETASIVVLMGGGLDTRLTRRIALRVSGDYQYSNFGLVGPAALGSVPYKMPGLPINFGRISSGLVWRF